MNNYAGFNAHDEVNDQDVQNLQNLMNFLMKSRSWSSCFWIHVDNLTFALLNHRQTESINYAIYLTVESVRRFLVLLIDM